MIETNIPWMRGGGCLDDEEGEESTETENEDMIHRDMNENETETNWGILDKVIQEWPDSTYPAMIEDCLNDKNLDDRNNHVMHEGKKWLDNEVRGKSTQT